MCARETENLQPFKGKGGDEMSVNLENKCSSRLSASEQHSA